MTSPASRCDEIVSLIDECLDDLSPPVDGVPRDDPDLWDLGSGTQPWWMRSVEVSSKPLG